MKRARPPAALLVLIMAAMGPTHAFHDPEAVLLAEHPVEDHGWVAYRIQLPGSSTLDMEFDGPVRSDETMAAAWLLDAEGAVLDFEPGFGESYFGATVHAQTFAGRAEVATARPELLSGGLSGVGWTDVPAGTYIALLAVAGDDLDKTLRLRASPRSTVLGSTSGADAFVATETDFTGAVVAAKLPSGVHAVVVDDASLRIDVEHRLFGLYGTFPGISAGEAVIDYEGPAGLVSGAPVYTFPGSEPGTYRLHIDHSSGAGLFGPAVYALGADVTLP